MAAAPPRTPARTQNSGTDKNVADGEAGAVVRPAWSSMTCSRSAGGCDIRSIVDYSGGSGYQLGYEGWVLAPPEKSAKKIKMEKETS